MGDGLSRAARCMFHKLRTTNQPIGNGKSLPAENGITSNGSAAKRPPAFNKNCHKYHSPSVPISICVMILICYVTLGAAVFHKVQPWNVLESLYFCFTSLGTIGFGEISPKGSTAQYVASVYILIGTALVAMCFSLIQSELVIWIRRFGLQDHMPSPSEEVAIVTVAVSPRS